MTCLEQRIEALEKEVAALKVQVSEQPEINLDTLQVKADFVALPTIKEQ